MSVVLMFPGQGSQFVGMGKEVYDNFAVARDVFCEVDEALGRHLSRIIFQGPDELLTATYNAQPALMAVSMALVRALEHVLGNSVADVVRYTLGHSVGEYTALCASGAIRLADAALLLDARGRAMSQIPASHRGGMAALIGGSFEEVEYLVNCVSEFGVCEIANDNCDGQIVVSGVDEALCRLPELARGTNIRKVVRLRVSGPFHSSLMHTAYEEIREFIQRVEISVPSVKMVFNVSATEHNDPSGIKDLVTRQIVSRVRWRESVMYVIQRGCSEFVELGPGQVLSGLLKRIGTSARGVSVGTVAALREVSGCLGTREFC